MSVTVLTAGSLLSYEIEPDPNPLTVSTAKDPVVGRLDISVAVGNSGPAFCKSIKVRIPIGAGASALTENRTQLTSSVVGASGWTARSGFDDGAWRVFEFVAERPVQVTGRAVTLVISQIEVNKAVGEAGLEIIEESSPTNGSFTPKTVEAAVQKFPAEFIFRNFRPAKVMVSNGEKAILKWDGSTDAEYTMFWDRSSQDVSNLREWTTPEPLTAPTGFMLQAKVTAGGVTLTHTLTTVVMVERPDLAVGNLDIGGKTTFRGGPLEGLVQDSVLLHSTQTKGTSTLNFRTQGPGIIYASAHMNASEGQDVEVYAIDVGVKHNMAGIILKKYSDTFGNTSQPIRAGQILRLITLWQQSSGTGTVTFVWYPLGPQEPPVRID